MSDKTLEIARGLAALWVFIFHVQDMVAAAVPALSGLAQYGSAGIWVFFVISGYCLYAATEAAVRQNGSAFSFLKRRLLRIYPPLWISVVVLCALPFLMEAVSALKTGTFLMPQLRWLHWTVADWLLALSLAKIFFAQQGDFQAAFSPINAVYWTLAIEVQFYLVMTLAVASGRYWRAVLLGVTVLSLLSWLSEPLLKSGLFLAFWPAFAMGFALRIVQQQGWTASGFARPAAVAAVGMACVVLFGTTTFSLLAQHAAEWSEAFYVLWFGALTAVALWFAAGLEPALDRALKGGSTAASWTVRAFVMLGASSYSLYLLHGKLYQLPAMFARQVVEPDSVVFAIFVVAATVSMSYAFFLFAERPFMSRRHVARLEQEKGSAAASHAQPAAT